MDTLLIMFALLPTRLLAIVPRRGFVAKPPEVRSYINESAAIRLGVSWLTWAVAMIYVAVRVDSDHFRNLVALVACIFVFLTVVVVTFYLQVTRPANKAVNWDHPFISVPLATRILRFSALNSLVLLGIAADVVVVFLKVAKDLGWVTISETVYKHG